MFSEEQLLAINYEGSDLLVSAGAGSGKTSVLTERVIRKLKEGVKIDELLILTFTEAAAKEMKERIFKKIINDESLKDNLSYLDNAYITTFDSFTYSLCKRYHYLLDIPFNLKITDESVIKYYRRKILDEVFNEYYENNDQEFLKLIKDYALKDDLEIKKYLLNIYEKMLLISDINTYLDKLNNNYKDIYNPDKLINEYLELIKKEKNNMIEIGNMMSEIDNDYASKINISYFREELDYSKLKEYLNIKLPNLPKGSSDDLKRCKEMLKDEISYLQKLCHYNDLIELKESLLSNYPYYQIIIKILTNYHHQVSEYFHKENIYGFIDIEKMAINLLKNNHDIVLAYQAKFKEILLDEYQDTSDIQEEFINLIANHNLFMVGDIKQSIYRFRNANPDLFKKRYDAYLDSSIGKRIDLNRNYRSREEIINDINLIFDYLMDNNLGGASYQKEHELLFGNLIYQKEANHQNNNLEILNYEKDDKIYSDSEIEAFIIAKDIQDKINHGYLIFDKELKTNRLLKYSDITILMYQSINFNLYKKIFEYFKIPLNVLKEESIKDSLDLELIKNIFILIREVNNKHEDTLFKRSFYSIGRSYLINLNDNELFTIFKNNGFHDTLLYQKIVKLSKLVPTSGISYLLKEIMKEFAFEEKIILVGDIEKRQLVFDYLMTLASDNEKTFNLDDFINYLEEIKKGNIDIKFKLKNDPLGVKLMTIHASKGLEFSLVYYAELNKAFNKKEIKDKFLYHPLYGMIMPYFNQGLKSSFLRYLYINDYEKEEISEKIRLFYVALTRCKEKAILITSLKSDYVYPLNDGVINNIDRLNYHSFNDFLLSIKKYLNNKIKDIKIDNLKLTKDYNLIKKEDFEDKINYHHEDLIINEYVSQNKYVNKKHFSKHNHLIVNQDLLKKGLEIHEILEYLDFKNPDYKLISKENQEIINKLIKQLDLNYVNIYHEYEFINQNEHGIIDLLLEYKDKDVIIDYKLKNINDDAYLEQLKGYQSYLKGINDKDCEIYLYDLLDGVLEKK